MGVMVGLAAGAVALAGAGGAAAYAALSAESQIFGRTLVAPREANEIALTYDDGPNPAATPRLLEVLARHGVRATFFLIGGYVRRESALVREMAAAGHGIGDHSMTHPNLALCSGRRIREELGDSKAAIEDVVGAQVRLFRPPFGARRPYVLRVAREMGMMPVMWNIICQDWTPIGGKEICRRAERGLERNRRRGFASNIVLHDGSQTTPAAERLETIKATEMLLERYAAGGTRYRLIEDWV